MKKEIKITAGKNTIKDKKGIVHCFNDRDEMGTFILNNKKLFTKNQYNNCFNII